MTDRRASAGVFMAVWAVHAAVAMFIGDYGWDDGTITLAFAKTFATTGKIALTAQSAQVEGYSSPLWFLMLAAVHRAVEPGFSGFIRASQLLTGVFAAFSAVNFFALLRHRIPRTGAVAVAIALFSSAPLLNETMNGMEMTCLALCALLVVRELEASAPRLGRLGVLAGIMVLTRFEAGPYIIGSTVLMMLMGTAWRTALAMTAGAAAGILATLAFRLHYFGGLVPNTVLAKRWEPYHEPGAAAWVASRLHSGTELLLPYFVALGILLVLAWRSRGPGPSTARKEPAHLSGGLLFAGSYSLLVWSLNVAIGKNWGYTCRMQLSAVPMMFWLLIVLATRPTARRTTAAATWAALAAVTVVGSAYFVQRTNVKLALLHWQGSNVPDGVTPATFRATGQAVDSVRERLELSRISFMTADVGGSSLCCQAIEIIDSGLLTDHVLAVNGYGAFARYLVDRHPDVIETHAPWSTLSGIYDSMFFRDNYRPVLVSDTWLYVRNDLVARLKARVDPPTPVEAAGARYRGNPVDETFIAKRARPPIFLQ